MADHFENAKDEILLRTEGNGGPSNRDMLKAMGALAKDVDEAIDALDEKQEKRHDESVAAMKEHICFANVRDERIIALEKWREESSKKCVERMTAIAKQVAKDVHDPVHAAHLAADHTKNGRDPNDPSDAQFLEKRESAFPTGDQRTLFELILGWGILKWVITGACMALIVWGVTFWASSCAEKAAHEKLEQIETNP